MVTPAAAMLALCAWPVMILAARCRIWRQGESIAREVVHSGRLILLRRGALRYTIEASSHILEAPLILHVPSWTQRHWQVHGRRSCELFYAEFLCPEAAVLGTEALLAQKIDPAVEAAAMERLIASHARGGTEGAAQAATELCAILARVLPVATSLFATGTDAMRASPAHPAVLRAVRHIAAHFRDSDVLRTLPGRHDLSDDHFRRLFRQHTGMTAQRLLTVCRMREARYLLMAGLHPVKRVAMQVGYEDPLYFSRSYRRFWGHPPSNDAP